jgi:hypothetical protein
VKSRMVLVTEDPSFIDDVRRAVGRTHTVLTCLGPAQGGCLMDKRGTCPLVSRSELTLVDSPPTGDFFDHYHGIPSILYAERLAQAHPGTEVLMCNPAVQPNQPSAFLTRTQALDLINQRFTDTRGEIDEG